MLYLPCFVRACAVNLTGSSARGTAVVLTTGTCAAGGVDTARGTDGTGHEDLSDSDGDLDDVVLIVDGASSKQKARMRGRNSGREGGELGTFH